MMKSIVTQNGNRGALVGETENYQLVTLLSSAYQQPPDWLQGSRLCVIYRTLISALELRIVLCEGKVSLA